MTRKWITLGFGFLVSAGCLWWVLSRQDLTEVAERIRQFGVLGMIAFASIHGLAQLLRGLRLWLLCGPDSGLSYGGALRSVFVGYAANNLVPLRVGEVVKASVLSRLSVLKLPQTLGLVAVERTMDGLILVGLLLSASAGLPDFSSAMVGVRRMAGWMALVFGGAIGCLVLIVVIRGRIASWLDGRRPQVVSTAAIRVLDLLSRLSDPRLVLRLAGVGLGIWLLEASVFWVAARWIGLDLGFWGALLCQGVAAVGIAVPSAPGNVGVFEAAVVLAVVFLGGGEQTGLALGVAIHAAHWLLDTGIGLVLMPGLGLKLGGSKATAGQTGTSDIAQNRSVSAGPASPDVADRDQSQDPR